ncbi:outer membrane beta-barrel protein [bacterium]|nr:outer membrane beta-barrel protein [bacterium]
MSNEHRIRTTTHVSSALLLIALAAGPAGALSVGNINLSDHRFFVGLAAAHTTADAVDAVAPKDKFEIVKTGFVANAGVNFTEHLSAYLLAGLSDAKLKDKADATGASVGTFDMGSSFSWGLGARASMELFDDFRLGGDFRFLSSPGHELKLGGVNRGDADLEEVHFAATIARPFAVWTPYFGLKISDVRVKTKVAGINSRVESEDQFGVLLGAEFMPGSKFAAAIEVRLLDETAASISTSWRF